MTTVWLDNIARAVIETEARKRPRTETGGALFGWETDDEAVVACAYGPGPRARHGAKTFEPHPATTDRLIRAVHEHSDGRYRYLGSWHTHPNGRARPSGTDVATAASVADEREVRLSQPIVLIQATRATTADVECSELRAWRWERESDWLLPASIEGVDLEAPMCPVVSVPRRWSRQLHVLSPTGT